jgi:hypothetical protein
MAVDPVQFVREAKEQLRSSLELSKFSKTGGSGDRNYMDGHDVGLDDAQKLADTVFDRLLMKLEGN